MNSIGLSELVIVALNAILIVAVAAAIVLGAIAVVRRVRSLEDRVGKLEKSIQAGSASQKSARKDSS